MAGGKYPKGKVRTNTKNGTGLTSQPTRYEKIVEYRTLTWAPSSGDSPN